MRRSGIFISLLLFFTSFPPSALRACKASLRDPLVLYCHGWFSPPVLVYAHQSLFFSLPLVELRNGRLRHGGGVTRPQHPSVPPIPSYQTEIVVVRRIERRLFSPPTPTLGQGLWLCTPMHMHVPYVHANRTCDRKGHCSTVYPGCPTSFDVTQEVLSWEGFFCGKRPLGAFHECQIGDAVFPPSPGAPDISDSLLHPRPLFLIVRGSGGGSLDRRW